ncbi:cytochrome C oxidase subunit IV family protein [Capnocytophaga canimorsus]|uniref:cytochrome C oxidase subunit IV family protein n=1 Tax=Capnocytophaga canimorsus TaxID=28188 RepID=UPI001ACFEA5C|nr:cytochrome C oxidase subunit IV family protein [Capnocytophaga canimorsus]GIM59599.1 cytochrome c oxidase subunit IV [Capnocytophaga canimorsus]
MAHTEHKLEIFRGAIKFKSNEQKIWGVLILLSIVTAIEVLLGIYRPEFLETKVLSMKFLNWIFIILTIVKAYYIAWDFMHMRDELKSFRHAVVLPLLIYIPYIIFIYLIEGSYINEVLKNSFMTWKF